MHLVRRLMVEELSKHLRAEFRIQASEQEASVPHLVNLRARHWNRALRYSDQTQVSTKLKDCFVDPRLSHRPVIEEPPAYSSQIELFKRL
jgi:hypothetical protein